jgi:hypothetical protein
VKEYIAGSPKSQEKIAAISVKPFRTTANSSYYYFVFVSATASGRSTPREFFNRK